VGLLKRGQAEVPPDRGPDGVDVAENQVAQALEPLLAAFDLLVEPNGARRQ
jgi:hypothetical protein